MMGKVSKYFSENWAWMIAVLVLTIALITLWFNYSESKQSQETVMQRYQELNRQYEEALKRADAALELEQKKYDELREQYYELTRPHALHEEVYDKLVRLDEAIKRGEEEIKRCKELGRDVSEDERRVIEAKNHRDESEKEWMNNEYQVADSIVSEAIELLGEIRRCEYVLARFIISDLTVQPSSVGVGGSVYIRAIITNTGEAIGSHKVILRIDDVIEETKEVTLVGGASQTVTFTVVKDTWGNYEVSVNSVPGWFTVSAAAPVKAVNGLLIGIIIAAAFMVISSATWLILKKRAAATTDDTS